MHGLIFEELKRYAHDRLGPSGWDTLLQRAGLAGKTDRSSRFDRSFQQG
jgi:hypothetical protein